MEATKKPQIVRVEIVRDFDKSYYANLYDENGGSHNLSKEYTDFRTLKALCKREYGVNLPNLSQIEFETHGRKSYAYISTETPQISTETAETVNVSAEGEKEAEKAFISMCIKHRKVYAPQYSHYSLYRYNDAMFAFGKEAEMIHKYFQNNKYCPLSEVEREHNGEKYLCFHVSHYNGDVKGRIRDLMEQKHIAEYGTPSNGLIAVWDAEEVEYWSHSTMPIESPQSPETPQTVECAAEPCNLAQTA